jgi:hypothetical protein
VSGDRRGSLVVGLAADVRPCLLAYQRLSAWAPSPLNTQPNPALPSLPLPANPSAIDRPIPPLSQNSEAILATLRPRLLVLVHRSDIPLRRRRTMDTLVLNRRGSLSSARSLFHLV